jgi:hypothetical protein
MNANEQHNAFQPPRTPNGSSDDGPEDMELTVPREPTEAINAVRNVFDNGAHARAEGLNTDASVFEKNTLFRTD